MSYNEFGGEPHKYFVNKLIFITTNIEHRLYETNESIVGILSSIEGIIAILKPKDKKELKNTIKQIYDWQDNINQIHSRREVKRLFGEVMDYLHGGWLKEVTIKPRFDRPGKMKFEREQ